MDEGKARLSRLLVDGYVALRSTTFPVPMIILGRQNSIEIFDVWRNQKFDSEAESMNRETNVEMNQNKSDHGFY
jgi:hypothetical protein